MISERFTATIAQSGRTATTFEVPLDVPRLFGSDHPPVKVTINGHTYRSTVSVYGGRYYVPLSRVNRTAAGVSAGESVEVALTLDEEPRKIEPPADLAAALDDDDEARQEWDRLSYSHRREYVEWLDDAKREPTRERRVVKAIEALRGGAPKGG